MDEDNVYVIEENTPLERTLRRSLHYRFSPSDSFTYLVDLPEVRNDALRPSSQTYSRARTSSIVNTFQLSGTPQGDYQDPLEQYVRKNLPNFRKSLTPEDIRASNEHRPLEEINRESIAANSRPASLNPDNKECNTGQKSKSAQNSNKMEAKPRDVDDNDYGGSKSKEIGSRQLKGIIRIDEKPLRKQGVRLQNDTDVIVVPAFEPVSVTHDSPFTKEHINSKKRPPSRVRVIVAVESSSDDSGVARTQQNVERRKRDPSSRNRDKKEIYKREKQIKISDERSPVRQTEKRLESGKIDPSSTRRAVKDDYRDYRNKPSRTSGEQTSMKEETKPMKKSDDYNNKRSTRNLDRNNTNEDDGFSSLDLMAKELKQKNKNRQKLKDPRASFSEEEKDNKNTSTTYTFGKTSSEDTLENRLDSKRKKSPFNNEQNKMVYVMAGDNTGGGFDTTNRSRSPENRKNQNIRSKEIRIPDRAVGGTDRADRQDRNQNQKYLTVKAPRSATKMVAKRRYHIQIPEHGRPETWFNIRFNMDDENNVEMNYEGPVKINNYYSSNNYT